MNTDALSSRDTESTVVPASDAVIGEAAVTEVESYPGIRRAGLGGSTLCSWFCCGSSVAL